MFRFQRTPSIKQAWRRGVCAIICSRDAKLITSPLFMTLSGRQLKWCHRILISIHRCTLYSITVSMCWIASCGVINSNRSANRQIALRAVKALPFVLWPHSEVFTSHSQWKCFPLYLVTTTWSHHLLIPNTSKPHCVYFLSVQRCWIAFFFFPSVLWRRTNPQ